MKIEIKDPTDTIHDSRWADKIFPAKEVLDEKDDLRDDVFMRVEWKTREELERIYGTEKDPEKFVHTEADWSVCTAAELEEMKHQAIVEAGFSLEEHNQLLHRARQVIMAHHSNEEPGDGGQWIRDFEDFMYGESTPQTPHK